MSSLMCIAQPNQAYLLTVFYRNMFTTIHSCIRELMDDFEYENEGDFGCKWCQKRAPSDVQMSCIYNASYDSSHKRKQPFTKCYNQLNQNFDVKGCIVSLTISKNNETMFTHQFYEELQPLEPKKVRKTRKKSIQTCW